jgi:hypothetical protein
MHHRQPAMESLEPRVLLASSPLTFEAYYPEGYANNTINEYVPITNHGEVEVEYELHARYEWGERDQLISSGRIAPHSRGGVTISEAGRADDRLVRDDVPYALVLKSTAPLSATISHYDFGTALGESFTNRPSSAWSFGEGFKSADDSRDYILVYNPGQAPVTATITVYHASGLKVNESITLGGERRGGWSIQDIAGVPEGAFSVVVSASGPVVAAQSHYQLKTGRGYGALGTPEGGATAGVVPAIEFDDDFYERNGDDSPHHSSGHHAANAYLNVLNTNEEATTVTLTFVIDASHGVDVAPIRRTLTVPGNSRAQLSIRDVPGIPADAEVGVAYRSELPVTVSGSVYQGMDATGVEAATIAATTWDFGEGFMSRSRAGRGVMDEFYIFNPGAQDTLLTIEFSLHTGEKLTFTKEVDGYELEGLKIERFLDLTLLPEDVWYGVRITSPRPVVASMEHWDAAVGGGFSTFGMPGGTIVDLRDVLTI